MNANRLAQIARFQRDHPTWTWAECEQRVDDVTAEYAADSRLAALLTHADPGATGE